jgi:predicted RNA-binding protein with RPS1 domain
LKKVPPEEAYSTHSNNVRKLPDCDKNDFKPLADHLNEWINKTLEEAKKEEN